MKLILIEPDGESGLAHFAYELGQAMAQEGHRVRLITSTHYELAALPHSCDLSPTMRLWPKSRERTSQAQSSLKRAWQRISRGTRLTWEWARVTRQVLAERPDFVIFSEILFPHLGLFLWYLKRRGIRLGQICHEFAYQEREGADGLMSNLFGRAAAAVYPQFDRIFFLSEATRNSFLERFPYDPSRTACIPHGSQKVPRSPDRTGAQLRKEVGLAADQPVVLFFGSIRPSKGVPDLIEAFGKSRSREKAKLLIAGQPTKYLDLSDIEAVIEAHGVQDDVILRFGYIPLEDVAMYFEAATCVALPYRSATQSGVLHLAYEFGRPVIATRVGGLAEDVRDGRTGYLVAPQDTAELAARLDDIISDPERARAMGAAGADLAQTVYTWQAAARIIADNVAELSAARSSVTKRRTASDASRAGHANAYSDASQEALRHTQGKA